MGSPFDVLRIDPDADEATIERAYRERVKEAHPDHGGSTEEFQRVRSAYEAAASDTRADPKDYADSSEEAEETDPEPEEPRHRVEYLNYERLADEGWALDDEDLFEKAAAAGFDPDDYGRFLAKPRETLLEAAENRGFSWPYSCRGGACANCAVAVVSGEMTAPVDHILPDEMTERGIRLSCVGEAITENMRVVYNVKHLPELDDLRLPPRPFERAAGD